MTTRSKKTTPARTKPPDNDSLTALVECNYKALRSIASREIVQRKLQRTTTPTSLVAETVMRIMRQREQPTTGSQLCGLATIMMTRALADRTRRTRARKRGAGRRGVELDDGIERDLRTDGGKRVATSAASGAANVALQSRVLSCLESLSRDKPREVEVLTLHLILGLPIEKVAKLMAVSRRTAYRCLADGLASLREEVGVEHLKEPT
jgi:RNA polymerase sigma factor (sigma-70 family)